MPERASRSAAIAAFYTTHAEQLRRAVTRRAAVPLATVEDACQTAWAQLLRRADITLDGHGLAWLTVVATHEAWRLASRAREEPMGTYQYDGADSGLPADPEGPARDPGELAAARAEHHQLLADLTQLKPQERRALFLQGLGYSYAEIGALTNATYTAVNRRLTEGRRALRRLARERERMMPEQPGGEADA